jgi:hypothetical protein
VASVCQEPGGHEPQRGTTPGEGSAAELAVQRLLRRLGEEREKLTERAAPSYVAQRARRYAKPAEQPLYVGDIIDCDGEGLAAPGDSKRLAR